ncbi:MAG: ABC transporter permease [Candidatus Promineifilaceae bacterium]|nr:ABC transporter permease [Candidatus Promineifilaceae bacterium]
MWRKILLVAWREFWQRVRTRGFILSALFTPVLLIVVWATGSFEGGPDETENPLAPPEDEAPATVAYVDQANLIERMPPGVPESLFQPMADLAAADGALAEGEIEAYYVIPPDYRETGNVRRISAELPAGPPETAFFDLLLRANLVPDAAPETMARAQSPFQSAELPVEPVRGEEAEETGDAFNMMPFLVAMLVMIPLFTSGSYLLYSLAEEKSNRIMEILLVSLQPRSLLGGKLLGLGALTLVQYVIWIGLGGGALLILGQDLSAITNTINLAPLELVLVLVYALGGYGLYATLMAGLGALSPNMEATRSWVFVITLPMLIPIYLWMVLVNAPNGPLAVALSLIPFSAPIAMLMRMTTTAVPTWQVIASVLLLAATAVFMVWLMSRLFRVQTLLSGEAFSLGRFWRVLREA